MKNVLDFIYLNINKFNMTVSIVKSENVILKTF